MSLLLQRLGYEVSDTLSRDVSRTSHVNFQQFFQRFIPLFKAEEIGILELPYMTEQRLQNLGIPLGPRLRILEEIQTLR